MNLHTYQQAAVDWLVQQERALVVSPAGSGKTIIAASAIEVVLEANPDFSPRIAWMANTKEQCEQAGIALWTCGVFPKTSVDIHCAAAGRNYGDVDLLIVDEAHHATAPGWLRQVSSCPGFRWGFTATPWGRNANRNTMLKAVFGGQVFTVKREEVSHRLCPANVVWLAPNISPDLTAVMDAEIEKELARRLSISRRYQMMPRKQAWGEVAWGVCCDLGIADNEKRNELAIQAASSVPREIPLLMLCNRVEHAQRMASSIGGVACYAEMGSKSRRAAMNQFKAGEITRLVATTLADEGLDLPMAEVLILVSGGRNEAKTIQRTGRVLRTHPGKAQATIFDFTDDFHPLLSRHAQHRARIYDSLRYTQQNKP